MLRPEQISYRDHSGSRPAVCAVQRTFAPGSEDLTARKCRELMVLQQVEFVTSNDKLSLLWRRPPQITSPPHSLTPTLSCLKTSSERGSKFKVLPLVFSPLNASLSYRTACEKWPPNPLYPVPSNLGHNLPVPIRHLRPFVPPPARGKRHGWKWRSFGSVVSSAMGGLVWRAGRGGV